MNKKKNYLIVQQLPSPYPLNWNRANTNQDITVNTSTAHFPKLFLEGGNVLVEIDPESQTTGKLSATELRSGVYKFLKFEAVSL